MAEQFSYTYKATLTGGVVVRSPDGAFIPLDLGNRDYQAFLEWIEAGNPAPEGWRGPR